jgi:hypothetical protein
MLYRVLYISDLLAPQPITDALDFNEAQSLVTMLEAEANLEDIKLKLNKITTDRTSNCYYTLEPQ